MSAEVICFEDPEGDILQVDAEVDGDGDRYMAIISRGEQSAVLLTPEQQTTLVNTLLGFDLAAVIQAMVEPTGTELTPEARGEIAERAASILRGVGFVGRNSIKAIEVIALAEWLANGDSEFAAIIESLSYQEENDRG